jgi:DNA-binding CsgD family transcriptional regulator
MRSESVAPRRELLEALTQRGAPADLGLIWSDLAAGRLRIVDSFHSQSECFIVAVERETAEEPPGNRSQGLQLLELLLIDGSQKRVAMQAAISSAAVGIAAKRCLSSMGLRCSPYRIPPLLVMTAYAFRKGARYPAREARSSDGTSACFRIISATRPDHQIHRALSRSESDVAQLAIEGYTHAEIARRRRTSPRTVANQLAAVFGRLRVSGRFELLVRLVAQAPSMVTQPTLLTDASLRPAEPTY